MAAPRPKSPRIPVSTKKEEESFWDKIGTLGRKKRIKEGAVQLLYIIITRNLNELCYVIFR